MVEMSLAPGTRLGFYDVVALLGAGGMGEVYRARDTRLGRDVAVKVITPALVSDRTLASRFDREAHLLASLTHPNVASVHGFEKEGGQAILVMELVEGSTLEERLADEAPPLQETLAIARQIAEALEYAHEHGIIHRDLKPANVKITPEGVVKVLDFGLAKMQEQGGESSAELTHSPTLSLAATAQGVVLGTAAYMSPEQAKGKTVDRRSDIWAFGVILYEMLARRRLFQGETVSDTLAAVLRQEIDLARLPPDVPPGIRRLLRRCLERDPRQRLRDIGEARIAIAEAQNPSLFGEPIPAGMPSRRRPHWIARSAAALGILAAGILGWLAAPRAGKPDPSVLRFSIPVPPGQAIDAGFHGNLAFSPDGRRIAFVSGENGQNRIYVRDLASGDPRSIPGTEGGTEPVFSPDGEWLGFMANGKLEKTRLNGAGLTKLAEVGDARGAAWLDDGTIVFAADTSQGLSRVSASGGTVQALTRLDFGRRERTHRWPEGLPGRNAVLFISQTTDNPEFYDNAMVEAVELGSGHVHRILEGASTARYFPGRVLAFARGGELFAQRFDPQRLTVSGEPVSVMVGVLGEPSTGAVYYSVSREGSIAYVAGNPRSGNRRLVRISPEGKIEPLSLPVRRFLDMSLSPDARRLALTVVEATDTVWIYDIDLGTFGKATTEGSCFQPVWISNDEILYARADPGPPERFRLVRAPAGGDSGKVVATTDDLLFVDGVTPDGRWALCESGGKTSRATVVEVALDGSNAVRPIAASGTQEEGSFSPDGRWIAYQSTVTGINEIYVRAVPPAAGQWQISSGGGAEPRWSRDGRQIYFRCGARLCAVAVSMSPTFSSGRPRRVVEAEIFPPWGTYGISYQVGPDGAIYALLPEQNAPKVTGVNVVWSWGKEIEKALGSR